MNERWWYRFLRGRIVGILYIVDGLLIFIGLDRYNVGLKLMVRELEWLSRRA